MNVYFTPERNDGTVAQVAPTSSIELLTRIRAEFLEMPGLRLTCAQAARFWNLDCATCTELLGALVEQGFLTRSAEGSYRRSE